MSLYEKIKKRYMKIKKDELIDLLLDAESKVEELEGEIEWIGDVEAKADERIAELEEENTEFLLDLLYDIRWEMSIETDPNVTLEKVIKLINQRL